MAYTNSPLVVYTKLSKNHSGQRTHSIDRITPHCVVGQMHIEPLGEWFYPSSTQASSNYGIGRDGRIGMYVEEKNRSWCSSSSANDQRAVTIECASDTAEPFAMKDAVYQSLIKLCVDICKRNGKNKLIWFGDKDKTLNYTPKSGEMILTVHRWFANKSCPGNWLYSRMGDLATKVTAQLQPKEEKPAEPKPEPKPEPVPEQPKQEEPKPVVQEKEEKEVRYYYRKEIKLETYKKTVDKLVEKQLLRGKGGEGDDMIIDMSEDAIRTLVILDRAGCFDKE